jgi:hypothetical protein
MVYQCQGQRSTQNYLQRKKYKYTIIYIFSVVDNFELIVGLGVGIPLGQKKICIYGHPTDPNFC